MNWWCWAVLHVVKEGCVRANGYIYWCNIPASHAGRQGDQISLPRLLHNTSCIVCKVEHYLRMLFTYYMYIHCASHEMESLHIVVSVCRWCDCCCCVCGEK